ncbi:hypothetical protein [Chondrinema litorale]|uniref:hypothetical protein n=1 Tax=Chondrinema litorale TaxID=2994555 RepID=UPI00254349D5|nr:hypothetical protein [Chondrinema litorale]UZR97885.1 hypothetical protein OQ292_29150 [Chondrinema litorale]
MKIVRGSKFIMLSTLHYLTFLFFVLQAGALYPQQANIKWGPKQKKLRRSALISDIIESTDKGVYAVMELDPTDGLYRTFSLTGPKPPMIQLHDHNLKLVKEVAIQNKIGNEYMHYKFARSRNGKIFVFSNLPNRQARTNFLFMETFDMETLTSLGPPQKIAESNMKNRSNYGSFYLTESRDKTLFMLYDSDIYEKSENEKFTVRVYNEDMELLWEKKITIPYTDKLFEIENYRVDNFGNAYILGIEYKDKLKTRRRGKPNYEYKILSYKNGGEEFKEYTVELEDKFITDLNFRIADNEDIICAGFYSDKGTLSMKGTYFLSVDAKSGKIKKNGTKQFDADFLKGFMSEVKAKKGNRELYKFSIDQIILRSDGGALLIAEQFYIREVARYNQQTGFYDYTYYYYYNDIIVINIRPDMSIEWATKIPKRQVTTNDGGHFSSYAYAIQGGQIHLIYNDNVKNVMKNNPDRTYSFNGKKSVVVLATINKDGTLNRKLVSSNKAEKILTRPKSCEQIADNEMIIYGELRKYYKIGAIQF